MVQLRSFVAALTCLLSSTLAARITVSIAQPAFAFDAATLPSSTHATLHAAGAPLTAVINRANQFVFSSAPSGSYLLEIHARDYVFEPLRVDVADEGAKEYVKSWQSFRGNEWDNKGEKRGEGEARVAGGVAKANIWVGVMGSKEYYAKRAGCKS
jgi:spore coat protein CotH